MRERATIIHSLLLLSVDNGSVAIWCDLCWTSINDTLIIILWHARVRRVPNLSCRVLLRRSHASSIFNQSWCATSAFRWSYAVTDAFVSIANFVELIQINLSGPPVMVLQFRVWRQLMVRLRVQNGKVLMIIIGLHHRLDLEVLGWTLIGRCHDHRCYVFPILLLGNSDRTSRPLGLKGNLTIELIV